MNWPTVRLAELATLRSGGTPSKAEPRYWDGDIPWLSSKDLTTPRIYDAPLKLTEAGLLSGSRLMPADTVVFVVRGMSLATEFRVSITKVPCAFNQDLKAVVCGERLLPDYLYYALYAQREAVRSQAGEASHGTKKLETRIVEQIPIRLPSLEVQRRLVSVAASYDDLIENNRKRIAMLEEAARLLYREWFVHLRFPGHEHVAIVDGLPANWSRLPVSELADLYRGKSYSSVELVEFDGQPFVNLKCIDRNGGFRSSGLKRFRGDHKPQHRVDPGDIVVAVTDMTRDALIVARAARIPRSVGIDAVFSMDLVKLKPKPAINAAWFYGVLRYSSFPIELREKAAGATVLHLLPRHIEAWYAPVPPQVLRDAFGAHLEAVLAQIDLLELQIDKLAEARDLLIPRLMNGEVAV